MVRGKSKKKPVGAALKQEEWGAAIIRRLAEQSRKHWGSETHVFHDAGSGKWKFSSLYGEVEERGFNAAYARCRGIHDFLMRKG